MKRKGLYRYEILLIFLFAAMVAKAQQPQMMLPIGHNLSVKQVDVSADGRYVISRSEDHTVITWENNTARIIRRVHHLETGVVSVMFAGKDNSILTLYGNGKLERTELVTGKKIYAVTLSKPVNEMMILGEDIILYYKKMFTGLGDALAGKTPQYNDIEIRKLASGKLVTTITGRYSIDHDPKRKLLAVATNGDEIRTYDEYYKLKQVYSAGAPVRQLKFSGTDIICTTEDNCIKKITNKGQAVILYQGGDIIKALSVQPDSNRVFGLGYKMMIIVNAADTSQNRHFSFKSTPEDIYLNRQYPSQLFFVLESGIVGYINYTTGQGGYLAGQKGWNNRIVAKNEKEFFTYGDDVFFIKWQPASFATPLKFQGYTNPVEYINYDSTSDRVLMTVKGRSLMLRHGRTLAPIPSNLDAKPPVSISPLYADSLVLLGYGDNKLVLYDYKNTSVFDSILVPKDSLQEDYVTAYANYQDAILVNESITVQAISRNNTVIFWDADNKLISKEVLLNVQGVTGSKNNRYVLVKANPALLFKKTEDDSQLQFLSEIPVAFDEVRFSDDEQKMVFTEINRQHTINIYDLVNDRLLYSQRLGYYILAMSNANGRDQFAAATIDSLFIFDLDKAALIKKIALHHGGTTAMHWKNDSILIVGNEDGVISYLDVHTGKILISHVIFEDGEQVIVNPEKYYSGDRSKIRLLHYVNPDLAVVGFDQLDIQYNRPDLVLRSLGNQDTMLINSYRNAYLKRIKRSGIDTSAFHGSVTIPQADFANRNSIAYEQTGDQLMLKVQATDRSRPLKKWNVWVNDVPLFGMNGVDLGSKRRSIDTTITITLNTGNNTIETSVINTAGIESYRTPLVVNHISTDTTKTEQLYFIGIGIDRFRDAGRNLAYCVKDIRDLATQLGKIYGANITIDTLFNEDVTAENIPLLKRRLKQSKVNDKVIVAYSGHGLLSRDHDYYLSTYSVNFDDPAVGGLPYSSFESLLDDIPARKKLVLIDACHSGEIDKEEMQQYERVAPQLNNDTTKGKGVTIPVIRKKTIGVRNSFQLMQELFVNVTRSTGATVISAAAGTQFAIERADLGNGVFTSCILNYMRTHRSGTVNQLKDHLNLKVAELTEGMQQANTRAETKYGDWTIWSY